MDDHLGTACVETDQVGAVISFEAYHPYGTSAYRAFQSTEVSAKRYRYTGKERDEETGLNYHGARYYAPWLGRWTAADPAGTVDGTNLYAYVRGSPVVLSDPGGTQGCNPDVPEQARRFGPSVLDFARRVGEAGALRARGERAQGAPAPEGKAPLAAPEAYERGIAKTRELRSIGKKLEGAGVRLIGLSEDDPKRAQVQREIQKLSRQYGEAVQERRFLAETVGERLLESGSLRFAHEDAGHHVANILEAAWEAGVSDRAQVSYILATAGHESKMGQRMTESRKQARLLGYSEKYRGRGYGHLTGESEYREAGREFGVDLVKNPELAAGEELSARILVWRLTEHGRRGYTLSGIGVREGKTNRELMIAWHTARKAHNFLGTQEQEPAHKIKAVAAKIYIAIGGRFAKKQ